MEPGKPIEISVEKNKHGEVIFVLEDSLFISIAKCYSHQVNPEMILLIMFVYYF